MTDALFGLLYVICYVLLLINAVERKKIQLYKIRYKSHLC